ncbi:saccharopine dehydrogenase [Streptomyces sp. NPDC020490]|uniref:saccharopine dehydrogenase n=1 Tax=Streptomyces sp. NPDC020490 TaxID=3365078 RepID=UPI0037944443
MTRWWLRHKVRSTERRAAVAPTDAARPVTPGHQVTRGQSPQRVFPSEECPTTGCTIAPAGIRVDAPADSYVVGSRELPDEPAPLRHRHVYGHAYKGRHGAAGLLGRFTAGGGTLLDSEHPTGEDGQRLVALGRPAWCTGAALTVLPAHDILISAVFCTGPVKPLLTEPDRDDPAGELPVLSDVTCDATSDCNTLPVHGQVTNHQEPARELRLGERPAQVIAIGNLPSLLPRKAGAAFSAGLGRHSLHFDSAPWQRAARRFPTAVEENVHA